jgi:hypothetical protein
MTGGSSALSARLPSGKGKVSTPTQSNPDAVCYNCDRKGHYKTDCWRPGGGKEGQGPRQQHKRGGRTQKQAANTAKEAEENNNYAFVTSDLAGIAKTLIVPADRRGAIVDSGASAHFCPDRSKFKNFIDISPQEVYTANGSVLSATRHGDVTIDLPLGTKRTTVTLKDALYAPTMAFTLISTNQIASAGLAVLFEGKMCKILSKGPKREVIAEIPQVQGLYTIENQRTLHAHAARMKLTVGQAHRALGHISQTTILHLAKEGLVEGVEVDLSSTPEFCEACMKAKASRKPFPDETKNRARTYAALVHTDLWGPAQTTSLGGTTYYISFTDDYTREMKVAFLKAKSRALEAFKHYETHLARQHPEVRLRKVRSYRGGEYLGAEFDKYLKDHGIE